MMLKAIDLLDYAVTRGSGSVYVIVKADGPTLSLQPNATPDLLRAVAADPSTYYRALLELVDDKCMRLEHDSRPEGGAELRYVVTDSGRDALNKFAPRSRAQGGQTMQLGAVAFLDVLGFKGIWRGANPAAVLEKLQALKERLEEARVRPDEPSDATGFRSWVLFLSDTLVIASTANYFKPRPEDEMLPLWFVCLGAADAVAPAAEKDPTLVYRGSIAFGEFEIREQFLIGPAIDEAAEAEKLAEGALIWLCPSAIRMMEEISPGNPLNRDLRVVRDYLVPLKEGRCYRTHVVNPLLDRADPDALAQRILDFFRSDRVDIAVKQQNTANFLRCACEHAQRKRESLRGGGECRDSLVRVASDANSRVMLKGTQDLSIGGFPQGNPLTVQLWHHFGARSSAQPVRA